MRGKNWLCGLLLATATGSGAHAQGWDGTIPALHLAPGDMALDLNGVASGAAFEASGHGGQYESGAAKLIPRLHRDFDSGLSVGLDGTITASDVLSRGRYDGDVFEKAFADVRTGLGRLEIGQTDGAAFDMAVTGPKVDDQVDLDDPQTTFFRDPSTRHAFTDIFTLRTEVGASSNYAKIAYISPAVFGAQLALSYTPSQGKEVLPFLHEGPHVADRQADIWEGAARYSDDVGPVTLSAYAGGAWGRGEHKFSIAGDSQEGVSDLGTGLRADYPVNDDVTLSLGGGWRQSNAYAFDIAKSFQHGLTRVTEASFAVTYDSWIAGIEYGGGDAGATPGAPRLGLTGYDASLGYNFSSSIEVSGGWQRLNYDRTVGTFYNGAPRIGLDAAFLHLNLKTSG